MKVDDILTEIIDEGKVVMIIAKPHIRTKLGYYIVSNLLKRQDTEGVYIALNIPHSTVEKNLKKLGADSSKVFFIDCITSSIKPVETTGRVIYLDAPNLVLLEGTLNHAINALSGEENFVYIESISTLLAYNSYQSFIRFLRKITNEIRLYGMVGIIFMLDKELEEVEFSQATTFVDDVIDLGSITLDDLR